MGLDISVYKLLKERPSDKKDPEYFRMIDDDGNYDRRGFPEWTKDYENVVTEEWYDWDKYKEQTGFDIDQWQTAMECYGPDGYAEMYPASMVAPEYDEDHPEVSDKFWDEVEKVKVKVYWRDLPKKTVEIKVIYRDEIGYQRKGLNDQFYKDYNDGKIGYFVWTKDELERYKKDYCGEDHVSEYDRHYICTPKRDFQEAIIDTFVEGECCVCFDW